MAIFSTICTIGVVPVWHLERLVSYYSRFLAQRLAGKREKKVYVCKSCEKKIVIKYEQTKDTNSNRKKINKTVMLNRDEWHWQFCLSTGIGYGLEIMWILNYSIVTLVLGIALLTMSFEVGLMRDRDRVMKICALYSARVYTYLRDSKNVDKYHAINRDYEVSCKDPARISHFQ